MTSPARKKTKVNDGNGGNASILHFFKKRDKAAMSPSNPPSTPPRREATVIVISTPPRPDVTDAVAILTPPRPDVIDAVASPPRRGRLAAVVAKVTEAVTSTPSRRATTNASAMQSDDPSVNKGSTQNNNNTKEQHGFFSRFTKTRSKGKSSAATAIATVGRVEDSVATATVALPKTPSSVCALAQLQPSLVASNSDNLKPTPQQSKPSLKPAPQQSKPSLKPPPTKHTDKPSLKAPPTEVTSIEDDTKPAANNDPPLSVPIFDPKHQQEINSRQSIPEKLLEMKPCLADGPLKDLAKPFLDKVFKMLDEANEVLHPTTPYRQAFLDRQGPLPGRGQGVVYHKGNKIGQSTAMRSEDDSDLLVIFNFDIIPMQVEDRLRDECWKFLEEAINHPAIPHAQREFFKFILNKEGFTLGLFRNIMLQCCESAMQQHFHYDMLMEFCMYDKEKYELRHQYVMDAYTSIVALLDEEGYSDVKGLSSWPSGLSDADDPLAVTACVMDEIVGKGNWKDLIPHAAHLNNTDNKKVLYQAKLDAGKWLEIVSDNGWLLFLDSNEKVFDKKKREFETTLSGYHYHHKGSFFGGLLRVFVYKSTEKNGHGAIIVNEPFCIGADSQNHADIGLACAHNMMGAVMKRIALHYQGMPQPPRDGLESGDFLLSHFLLETTVFGCHQSRKDGSVAWREGMNPPDVTAAAASNLKQSANDVNCPMSQNNRRVFKGTTNAKGTTGERLVDSTIICKARSILSKATKQQELFEFGRQVNELFLSEDSNLVSSRWKKLIQSFDTEGSDDCQFSQEQLQDVWNSLKKNKGNTQAHHAQDTSEKALNDAEFVEKFHIILGDGKTKGYFWVRQAGIKNNAEKENIPTDFPDDLPVICRLSYQGVKQRVQKINKVGRALKNNTQALKGTIPINLEDGESISLGKAKCKPHCGFIKMYFEKKGGEKKKVAKGISSFFAKKG